MIKTITVLFFCGLFLSTFGQIASTGKIKATVWNDQHIPVENVTVQLMNIADSSLLKVAITDKEGVADFEHIHFGNFFLKITAINFAPEYSAPFILSADQPYLNLPVIEISKKNQQLKEVVVSGKKPFIQKLNDRIVVNVENSIVSAGSTAMDVLERSPGVTIDQNDQISLRGKKGVIIMIDEKITPLSGTDLANFLKSLPSNSIERIDIITNPSAKYDASGNSGIIDIHMKKDQRLGINGTLTANYGQGIYPKTNEGMTFNYRNKKVNFFGNYSYAYREGLNHLVLDRNFYSNGVFNGEDKKDNYTTFPYHVNVIRFGGDFFPGKKTIIGFVINSNLNHFNSFNTNNSTVINADHQAAYTFQTHDNGSSDAKNTVGNVNFKHTFDSTGKEFTADIDYGVYNSTALSSNTTAYYKLTGATLQPSYILNGNQKGKLTLKTGKADYVNPLKHDAKIEAGFKTSYVSSDNDAKFFDASSGIAKNDTTKTNHFIYDEYNNAGYLNFSKEFKKFNIQVGLRGEHTKLKTYQVRGDARFDSSYFKLFPSAFLNYKINKDNTLGFSVSRRIDRPNYSLLNPFLFLIDVSTYNTGNPALLPQFTWSYELSYTVRNISLAFNYSHTKDVLNIAIAKFKDVFPMVPLADSNITVEIPVNLEKQDHYGLSVSAPVRITSWWNMINNADFYYNSFTGNLGGSALNNGSPAADVKTNNTFTLGKGWTSELNATFNSGGRDGYMVARSQWGLSTGVQKSLLKNRGTIRFNMTDIFWTNLPRATITYPGKYIENWHAYRESRVGTISFSYRFGKTSVQAARKRSTGSEEERQRAQ
jgi:Outer membrane receptor proteins, mostly Fe transport